MSEIPPIRIMVAPLDWGLGHATRCIPVIDALLARGVEVILASSGRALTLLTAHYPKLEAHKLPEIDLTYGSGQSQVGAMLLQAPRLFGSIRADHRWLKNYLKTNQINAIISDHRLGMWHSEIPSILIAHQIAIQPPAGLSFLGPLLFKGHWRYVDRFDEIWVPDLPGEKNLAGQLVPQHLHSNEKVKFIGPLSHLSIQNQPPEQDWPDQVPLLVILSGLEPQRSLFEKIIRKEVKKWGGTGILVQGLSGKIRREINGKLTVVNFLNSIELAHLCRKAEVIISRTGYSSLMDYAALGKEKLILVPTPGQTEQEYLSQHLASQQIALIQHQGSVDIVRAFEQLEPFNGFLKYDTPDFLLKKGLDAFFSRIMPYNS